MKNLLSRYISSTEKSGFVNMILKPISLILSLLYTPLLLSYLGDEKYGLWATILSVISWINYFDIGIHNGLRNVLSKEIPAGEYKEAQKSVSTATVVLSLIAGVLLIILVVLTLTVNWNKFFSTEIDMRSPVMISFVFICVNFILSISNIVYYALQKSERVSIRGCAVQLLNIIGVFIASKFSDGQLSAMAFIFGGSSTIIYIIAIYSLLKKYEFLHPRISFFAKNKVATICNLGIKFFVIQLMGIAIFSVDNMIISHYLGPECVTPFSIADKLFRTAYSFLGAFLIPYWSRATEAFTLKDFTWISNSIKKTSIICITFSLCYIVLILFFPFITHLWLGRSIDVSFQLLLVMGGFYTIYSFLAVVCSFINGSGKITFQMILYIIVGIANIPLSIFFCVNCDMGVLGVRLATTVLVFLLTCMLWLNLKRIIQTNS